ncbi:MAG: GntR family transcriptional regulator [Planctomycetes bacterium]|nr:GntR family transcriptional regulator [Planctomycetota bacterium]
MGDPFAGFNALRPQPVDEQIADLLRRRIASGELPPGARLPPTDVLARQLGVTITRLQSALRPLVRAGLLERRQRQGTVVRAAPPAIARVGLYRGATSGWGGRDRYAARLERLLTANLAALGVACTPFHDHRPEAQRVTLLAELRQALRAGSIDALIACESDRHLQRLLRSLPIPVAGGGGSRGQSGTGDYDFRQFADAGVACLAARGCRSAGLIAVAGDPPAGGRPPAHAACRLPALFRQACQAHGLATADGWLHRPAGGVREAEAEAFGRACVQALWAGPAHPDGLLVYTDLAARGVVAGLLAALDDDTPPPALALHRNRELGLFCPFPADFLEARLEHMAEALWQRVLAQRQGLAPPAAPLPFTVVAGGG